MPKITGYEMGRMCFLDGEKALGLDEPEALQGFVDAMAEDVRALLRVIRTIAPCELSGDESGCVYKGGML
tara:strand:- start:1607 stop:1816 length:210 start_codon:yes stop_codon:yes gene_type:complete